MMILVILELLFLAGVILWEIRRSARRLRNLRASQEASWPMVMGEDYWDVFFEARPDRIDQEELAARLGTGIDPSGRIRRGCGYCTNPTCEEYTKGVFLLNFLGSFYCSTCRCSGETIPERGEFQNQGGCFREVRIEFNYNPTLKEYKGLAVLTDTSLSAEESNTYTLYSPLIQTPKRALKTGEDILASLQYVSTMQELGYQVPSRGEIRVSFDDKPEDFQKDIKRLQERITRIETNRGRFLQFPSRR